MKQKMTLEQFAELINSADEWNLSFYEIIRENGWNDETGGYGICSDSGGRRLAFNDQMEAVII